ncbi:O-acyltransferase WSD1-like [Papaver somniferum]|uniref:O-acyltransferase WSD1-like n=1 Tax=Papaver somniferum TaxID=3469 RepID=UPI000E6FB6D5|nr:O-acyltransferase WSD1-like [Papaver somniferum]
MERNKKGVLRWKKVDVRMEDHLIVPTFPIGLSREGYDEHLREYLTKIGCEKFSDGKPLLEVHLVKYPSLNGACTMIFKFSHALGDGYSFIRVFFKCCERADKSSTPLTFPQLSLMKTQQQYDGHRVIGLGKKLFGLMRTCMNTSYDLMDSLLRTTFFEDRPSAVRSETSANMKIELFRPFNIHSVTLSLERVKQVKTKLGATVNDVILGLLSYIIHLYAVRKTKSMEQYGEDGSKMDSINVGTNTSMTICVMLNMRIFKGFTSMEDMIRADAWGNHSRLLLTPLPTSTNLEEVNPLDFIIKAKHNMDRKKNSMIFYFIESLLKTAMWTKGQKGIDDMLYSSFKNTTTLITSVIGPKEQMAIMNHPVSSFYYFVSGVSQSITFTSVSCMEQLKLVVTMEKGFIDSELFISCMDEAFDNIFRAAIQNQPGKDHDKITKKRN